MHKLVIDTCVFVEGFIGMEESSSSILLDEIDKNGSRYIFSMDTVGELLYILKKECNSVHFEFEQTNIILTTAVTFFQNGKSINTRRTVSPFRATDPDDQMFIDAAYEAGATHIITLDKKSGILQLEDTPFKCMTPDEYLESLVTVE